MAEVFNAADLLKNAGAPDRPSREPIKPKSAPEPEPSTTPDTEIPSLNDSNDLKPAERKLAEELSKLYVVGGITAGMLRQDVGMAIASCADEASVAWVLYARSNPAVKRALNSLVQSSALGVLVMAHAPIIMMVAQPVVERFIPQTEEEAEQATGFVFTPESVPGFIPGTA